MLCWPRARLLSRRFLMKKIKFPLLLVLVAALLAGCGGGSGASLNSSDVATVGKVHVSKAAFAALLVQAKRSYASQTPPKVFPKPGTADYETIKGQAVALLVQQAEREAEGRLLSGSRSRTPTSRSASTRSRSSTSGAARRSTRPS